MPSLSLTVAILAAAFLLWLILYRGTRRLVMSRRTGLWYFKLLLKQRGVDLSRIPDAALFEIIAAKATKARVDAFVASATGTNRRGQNWRINLVRTLEVEANLIVVLMGGKAMGEQTSDAALALAKHGVIAPTNLPGRSAFTHDSFAEATRNGTLYAELSARLARQDAS